MRLRSPITFLSPSLDPPGRSGLTERRRRSSREGSGRRSGVINCALTRFRMQLDVPEQFSSRAARESASAIARCSRSAVEGFTGDQVTELKTIYDAYSLSMANLFCSSLPRVHGRVRQHLRMGSTSARLAPMGRLHLWAQCTAALVGIGSCSHGCLQCSTLVWTNRAGR